MEILNILKGHHFKLYPSCGFTLFTTLFNRRLCVIPGPFVIAPGETQCPLADTPQARVTTTLLFVSMGLRILDISY